MSEVRKIAPKRSISFEVSPQPNQANSTLPSASNTIRAVQEKRTNQFLKGYLLRGNSPLKPRIAKRVDTSPTKDLCGDLSTISSETTKPQLFRKGLYNLGPSKRKETMNSNFSDDLSDSSSRLRSNSPLQTTDRVDSTNILSKKQITRPDSTSPIPFGSEISTTSGASEKNLTNCYTSMSIQKNPSGVSVISEAHVTRERTASSSSKTSDIKPKIDGNELKRAYYEKVKFLREAKKSSDETHHKYMAKLKILHHVAWKVDELHRDVYGKLAKKKFFEESESEKDLQETTTEQNFSGYQHINNYFNHEIKNFITRSDAEQKNQNRISKSSVEDYLTNLLTVESAIINKAMRDGHEDVAAMLQMLIEINVLEFEDVLASYVINLNLEDQTIEDSSKNEAIMLRKKLKEREERFKYEQQRNFGYLELVQRKIDRVAEKRRELERLLMDKMNREQL